MDQKFGIGLNSRQKTFAKKFAIDEVNTPDVDLFEAYSNYIVLSNLLEEDFEMINKVSTGKIQGIDGLAIIINNQLVVDDADLAKIGENEKLHIQFCFIQSTTQRSWDHKKFQSYIDSIISFLLQESKIEPFSEIVFNKLLNEENDFLNRLKEAPKVFVYFSSARTSHTVSEKDMGIEMRKFTERSGLQSRFRLEPICILQEEELTSKFDNIDKFLRAPIKFHKSKQLDRKNEVSFSLISSLKFKELRKLIETKDKNLREKLFIENPRSVIENSTVNDKITETLTKTDFRDYFIYLNNGLTILCDEIQRHEMLEDVFYLTYPRIINGCQTTHMLFDYHEDNPDTIDDIEVFVKVIATKNEQLKKEIIFATNNQNSIDKDLQALNDFHAKLEEYFQGIDSFQLYYERLRGQHSTISPPYKKVDIETMAKAYLSVMLRVPHEMKSNAIKKTEKYQQRGQIFKGTNYDDYYYSAILLYYLNYFQANNIIKLRSQTMDMHLLLACDVIIEQEGKKNTDQKLKALKDEDFTKRLFIKVNNMLSSYEGLFERRGFYSGPKTNELIKHLSAILSAQDTPERGNQ